MGRRDGCARPPAPEFGPTFAPKCWCPTLPQLRLRRSRVFHRVAAELVPQRLDHLRAERVYLPRAEARLQRQRDHGSRDVEIDGLLDGPTPFTRVGDPALDVGKRFVARERTHRKVVEPRTHDAPMLPHLADLP